MSDYLKHYNNNKFNNNKIKNKIKINKIIIRISKSQLIYNKAGFCKMYLKIFFHQIKINFSNFKLLFLMLLLKINDFFFKFCLNIINLYFII